jgi:hypothetical protein
MSSICKKKKRKQKRMPGQSSTQDKKPRRTLSGLKKKKRTPRTATSSSSSLGTSKRKKKTSSSSSAAAATGRSRFTRLTDCHKVILRIAVRKCHLYKDMRADLEAANYPAVLEYIQKNISRNAEKALVKMYRDIEKVRNSSLTAKSPSRSGKPSTDDFKERAQSSR